MSTEPHPPSTPDSSAGPGNPARSTPAAERTVGVGISFLASLIWAAVNLVLTLALADRPDTATDVAAYVGSLILPTVLGALLTWVVGRQLRPGRKFWHVVLLALPYFLLFRAVIIAGAGT